MVTGGLGFIGSNLAIALAEGGAQVTVIDVLDPRGGGDRRNLDGFEAEVIIGSIDDAAAVTRPIMDADYVFNLAGQVSHIDSMEDPVHDLDLNARSQLGFLELLRRSGSRASVIYASTRQVYGRPESLPVTEDHPLRPVDVNGIAKAAAERLHLLYQQIYGIPISILRISNVYGPRQRLEGDHQGFLPVFMRQVLSDEPITVFGDGSHQRECLYVDDAIRALLIAASAPEAMGETFNISHSHAYSLREIAERLVAVAGGGRIESLPWPENRKRIAIGSSRVDCGKASATLGWEPVEDLTEGFEKTLAFARLALEGAT